METLMTAEEVAERLRQNSFDSPHERLRQLTSWSHSHAKRHGFDKLSEKEVGRIVHGNRKRHREAEDRI